MHKHSVVLKKKKSPLPNLYGMETGKCSSLTAPFKHYFAVCSDGIVLHIICIICLTGADSNSRVLYPASAKCKVWRSLDGDTELIYT